MGKLQFFTSRWAARIYALISIVGFVIAIISAIVTAIPGAARWVADVGLASMTVAGLFGYFAASLIQARDYD